MKIKDSVQENCPTCHRFVREISPEQHGCDQCRKPIEPCGNDERLEISVFTHREDTSTQHYYFCSWDCTLRFAAKIHTDYFFTLPYACTDHKIVGRRAKDLQKILRKLV